MGAVDILRARVEYLRQHKAISRRDLGKIIGMKDAYMAGFLSGRQGIALERLDPLARVFGVEVADLFNPNASAEPSAMGVPLRLVSHGGSPATYSSADPALLALLEEYRRALDKLVRLSAGQNPDSPTRRARPPKAGAHDRRARPRKRSA